MTAPLETLEAFAGRLAAAHDGGPVIDAIPPHLIPADWAAIYALQDAIIARTGPIGGWKIMAGGASLNCAPIPANRYHADGATIDAKRHRLVIAEVEVAVKLGADIPADADLATAEAAIASIHPVIEMIGSPFPDRHAVDNNSRLGDLQSNGMVIVGPALDWGIKDALLGLPATLYLDGAAAHENANGPAWADVVAAIHWLAGHAAQRGLSLGAGQVIITGARALAPNGTATEVEGRLGNWGVVTARMTY